MRDALRLLVTALAITGFALGAGLLVTLGHHHGGSSGADSAGPATPGPTSAAPLADVDTTHLAVRRASFCSAVPTALVTEALGGPPTRTTSYGDEQRGALTATVTDLAHEYDCTWSTATRTARAWVFAPPITPAQGDGLAAAARGESRCRRLVGAPAYGSPTAAVRCRDGGTQTVSFHGLFGEAWLSCSLSGPRSDGDLADEAGRWCGVVAQVASGS